MTTSSFTDSSQRAKYSLRIIHTKVCRPFKTMSRNGEWYFITFTDELSRYGYVYLMKNKHEEFEMFKLFPSEFENQLNQTIKILRSGRGWEYLSGEILIHLESHGLFHKSLKLEHHDIMVCMRKGIELYMILSDLWWVELLFF